MEPPNENQAGTADDRSVRHALLAQGDACHVVRDFISHFANPLRLRILCRLIEGSASVTELVEASGARQPAVSQQLHLLRLAGIVTRTRVGSSRVYEISDPIAEEMMEFIFVVAEKLMNRQAQNSASDG